MIHSTFHRQPEEAQTGQAEEGRPRPACSEVPGPLRLHSNPAMPGKTVTSDKLFNLFVLEFPPKRKEENDNNSSYLVGLL